MLLLAGEASHNDGIGGENRDQQTVVPTSPSSSGGFHQFPSKGYVKKTCLWIMEHKYDGNFGFVVQACIPPHIWF